MSTRLSRFQALILNLNIMLGAGIFVNAPVLGARLGSWGWVCYALIALAIVPLTRIFGRLMDHYQGGSFFRYSEPLGRWAGFASQWVYFVGKLASSTVGVQLTVLLLLGLGNRAAWAPWIIPGVIGAAVLLCAGNVRIAERIQYIFLASKLSAILAIIVGGLWYRYVGSPVSAVSSGIPDPAVWWGTLPLALYTFTGFEATCSLASRLARPAHDGPVAIFGSFVVCVVLAILFQQSMWALLGAQLAQCAQGADALAQALCVVAPAGAWMWLVSMVVTIAVALSCLGAAYGSLYSNGLNMVWLADHQQIPGADWIRARNRWGAPVRAYIIAGLIMVFYWWGTQGILVSLQQANSIALLVTFGLSSAGWWAIARTMRERILGIAGVGSCMLLGWGALWSVATNGAGGLAPFSCMVLLGIGLFFIQRQRS